MAAALHALARSPVKRAVHLHISPRPASIHESSEIMRIMSQFGEIEYYKSFKYDTLSSPKTAVVIYREEGAATECLRQSPIRFHLSRRPRPREVMSTSKVASVQSPFARKSDVPASPSPKTADQNDTNIQSAMDMLASWGLGIDFASEHKSRYIRPLNSDDASTNVTPEQKVETSDDISTQADTTLPTEPQSQEVPDEPTEEQGRKSQTKAFTVLTSPAHINFREHIDNSRLANGFAIDTKTAAQRDLAGRVPHLGLSDLDWRTQISWRHSERAKRAERDDPNRKTLRQLYDEGLKDAKNAAKSTENAVNHTKTT